MTTRTAVGLRRILAALALAGGTAGAIVAWRSDWPGATVAAGICLVVALVAAVNLAYLIRRY